MANTTSHNTYNSNGHWTGRVLGEYRLPDTTADKSAVAVMLTNFINAYDEILMAVKGEDESSNEEEAG